MRLFDVNVLVEAHRVDMPRHAEVSRYLARQIDGDAPFGMAGPAIASFVRIVTNRRIFPDPTPIATAIAEVENIVRRPRCVVVQPGPAHLDLFPELCRATGATDNQVPDTAFAALAIEHGCRWVTFDRGFARYPGLAWETPGVAG